MLTVSVGREKISGENVRIFLANVVQFLLREGALKRVPLPFQTGSSNYLLAEKPVHRRGKRFVGCQQISADGRVLYIEVNHSRPAALRHACNLIKAAGLSATLD
jgi:hypothetical protein